VYKIQPDVIVETGVSLGGSIIFWASIQKLCGFTGKVLGLDIDIYNNARNVINESNFKNEMYLIQDSSIDNKVIDRVANIVHNISVLWSFWIRIILTTTYYLNQRYDQSL
jgi:cephalosporin hydroxylase